MISMGGNIFSEYIKTDGVPKRCVNEGAQRSARDPSGINGEKGGEMIRLDLFI
jgi:hypothetical protein